MSKKIWVAVGAMGLLGWLGPVEPLGAQSATVCTFEFNVTLSPGLSSEPTSGTHGSEAPGVATCDGPVNGKEPTGDGTLEEEGLYGTEDPDTCAAGGEGTGTDTLVIPTADGAETVVSKFTFTFGDVSTKGGVVSGKFEGDRFSGTFEFTPLEGDCVTAPVTRVHVAGEGMLHD